MQQFSKTKKYKKVASQQLELPFDQPTDGQSVVLLLEGGQQRVSLQPITVFISVRP